MTGARIARRLLVRFVEKDLRGIRFVFLASGKGRIETVPSGRMITTVLECTGASGCIGASDGLRRGCRWNPVLSFSFATGARRIVGGFSVFNPVMVSFLFLFRSNTRGLPSYLLTSSSTIKQIERDIFTTSASSPRFLTRCLSRYQSQNRSLLRHTSALSPLGIRLSAHRRGEQSTGEDVSDTWDPFIIHELSLEPIV